MARQSHDGDHQVQHQRWPVAVVRRMMVKRDQHLASGSEPTSCGGSAFAFQGSTRGGGAGMATSRDDQWSRPRDHRRKHACEQPSLVSCWKVRIRDHIFVSGGEEGMQIG